MASLGKKYTAGDVSTEQRDYEDLPTGIYQLEIEASDVVETGPENARTGVGLKYTAVVLAPEEVKGRKYFGFVNLENKNSEAQRIGQEEFARLRRSIGVEEIDESEELHFRTFTVKLGMGKPSKKLNADGTPMYPARVEPKVYYFPDDGPGGHGSNIPEPAIDAVQPTAAPANDNRQSANPSTARSTNNGGAAASSAGKPNRPWGSKAA
ncbi:hypothetical protein [Mesorhizobium sp. DCY119]|uniref:hypothetical protein n=1 Tax=Mesorhizobium sp. DCY119 TaxID=2108445 RepID=UPI000E6BE919|nr:hypothetical protein [Mesorhizobium sp. DCY119]RJG46534.1 hypothetical protein D3Y55_21305 [Mesorhizobium sp. DCY119]